MEELSKDAIEAVERVEMYVQDCREEGEGDLRQILHYIQALKKGTDWMEEE